MTSSNNVPRSRRSIHHLRLESTFCQAAVQLHGGCTYLINAMTSPLLTDAEKTELASMEIALRSMAARLNQHRAAISARQDQEAGS